MALLALLALLASAERERERERERKSHYSGLNSLTDKGQSDLLGTMQEQKITGITSAFALKSSLKKLPLRFSSALISSLKFS